MPKTMNVDLTYLQDLKDLATGRGDFVEPTFRCGICCDTGFLVRVDSKGRRYGKKCECLLAKIAANPKEALVQFKRRGREVAISEDEGIPF